MRKTNQFGLSVILMAATILVGCSQSTGQRLGSMWVAHNSAVATVTELGSGTNPVLSVDDLKEFNSYQSPVIEGLNLATEDYLSGSEADTLRTLEYLDPLLMRMLELTAEEE